jgi:hypothetical protein
MVAQRRAHRGESSSVGCTGAEPCRFTEPVLARMPRLAMARGRATWVKEDMEGPEGEKGGSEGVTLPSASLSAKAAAWFLTRMAESHPQLIIIPLFRFLPASAARPSRYEISAPRRVPLQNHHSPTPAHPALLHCLLQEPQRNRNPNPNPNPSLEIL